MNLPQGGRLKAVPLTAASSQIYRTLEPADALPRSPAPGFTWRDCMSVGGACGGVVVDDPMSEVCGLGAGGMMSAGAPEAAAHDKTQ